MAISDTQKVDYLWKKIGYAATKTDTTANKDATNEALPSPLQIRGDSLLVQSSSIPSSIPATTTSIVTVYRPDATLEMPLTAIGTNGPGQRGQLGSATAYRTWQTGTQNWISPEFGATYSVRVFLDTPGITTSNTTGTELFATATNEEWFFDYQSGVLNFSGANLPSGISTKSVYISGARYTGEIGIANTVNTAAAAFAHANAAFATANSGGAGTDSYARNTANAAFLAANSSIETNVTQNNSIIAAFAHANAAFTTANSGGAGTDSYARNTANAAFASANNIDAVNITQNNSIAAVFLQSNNNVGVDLTQNNSITAAFIRANNSLNANTGGNITGEVVIVGNLTSNTLTTTGSNGSISGANAIFTNYIFAANGNVDLYIYTTKAFDTANGAVAVNLTQNNSIASAFIHANAAFAAANSGGATTDVYARNTANAAFLAANNAAGGVDTYARNTGNSAFIHANAAFASANTIDGVNVTQNNSITAAFAAANAAVPYTNATANVYLNSYSLLANTITANSVTISGDIVITGNILANIVGGTF